MSAQKNQAHPVDTYVDVDGARIHCRIDGDERAPVVVLSNSLGTDLAMWEPQVPELARVFRVVRYDTRGTARRRRLRGRTTLSASAAMLSACWMDSA